MSYRLPRYRVFLIREGSCNSDHNAIHSPEDVFAIMVPELHKKSPLLNVELAEIIVILGFFKRNSGCNWGQKGHF
jgi:hypothetical protein